MGPLSLLLKHLCSNSQEMRFVCALYVNGSHPLSFDVARCSVMNQQHIKTLATKKKKTLATRPFT